MSDAVSDNMKVESSEKEAYKFKELLDGAGAECEIIWKAGHPLAVTYGSGFYKRELLLYPEQDEELLLWLLDYFAPKEK